MSISISTQREMRGRRIANAVAYLDEYRKLYKKTGEEIAQGLGKAAAKQLANYTYPWGMNPAIGKKFEMNLMLQGHRALKAANVSGAQGGPSQVHKSARNSQGQVPKNLETKGRFQRAPIELSERMAYTEGLRKQAGIAKGAWISAGENLGAGKISGVPKWIRRHAKNGSAAITQGRDGAEVTLTNELDFVRGRKFEQAINPAMAKAYKGQLSRMRLLVKKYEKSATAAQ
jgi:hypothetical protein